MSGEALTTSYRWQGHPKGAWKAALKHNVREPGEKHANPDIDPARLALNQTLVPDGQGGWEEAKSRSQIRERIEARLAQAKAPTRTVTDKKTGEKTVREIARRKDAVEVEEFLVQLDPEWTGTCGDLLDDDEHRAAVVATMRVMVDRVVELVGWDNVHAVSWHWDETNPHAQILTTPITANGELSFKKLLPGTQWSAEHDTMRERLRQVGYEATFERVDGGRGHDKLTNFKRRRDEGKKVEAKARVAARDVALAREDRKAAEGELAAAKAIRSEAEADAVELKRRARRDGYVDGKRQAEVEAAEERRLLAAERAQVAQGADAARRAQEAAQRAQEAAEEREAEVAAERDALRAVGAQWDAAMRELKAKGLGVPKKAAAHARRGRDLLAEVEAAQGVGMGRDEGVELK